MPELIRTSKENGHDHIAYVRDDGTGSTSKVKGHLHPIVNEAPVPEIKVTDIASPVFGQVVQEATPGGTKLMPADDGHTHDLSGGGIEGKEPDEEKDEQKIVKECIELWLQAKENEKESREKGNESEKIYAGNQWDKKKKDELEAKDRAALTIDKCSEKIDNLSGYQRQNRTDFRMMPTEEGDQNVADILNIVTKNITESCSYHREETKVFLDQAIPGRGNFNCYIDYDTNMLGDIVVEQYPWDEVFYGPHNKEDLSDCEYLVKTKWYSKRRLLQMYPDKADKFRPDSKESDIPAGTKSEDWDKSIGKVEMSAASADLVNDVRQEYRLLDVWLKEYRRAHILVHAADGFVFNAEGWADGDVKQVKSIDGFTAVPRVTFRIRERKVISQILLEDDYPDLAIQDFHTIPVYATRRGNAWWGKIEKVKDLQNLINKAYSQFTDIMNRMAAYGWFYDNNTFNSRQDKDKFKKNASKPGFTQEVSDVTKPPLKIEGTKFPTEIVQSIAMFNQDIREIMNINLEMLQGGQQYESGIAIRQKIIQQLLGNDFMFDNLSFAKKKVGKIILAMIQKCYDAKRILRIVKNQNQKEPVEIGGKKMTNPNAPPAPPQEGNGQPEQQWDESEIVAMLENADLSKYDVMISEATASPSAMMGNFLFLLEMASKGVQIPASAFFRFAPIPGKEKIMEEIQAQAAAQQASEDKKYGTEIQKAKIAQEGKLLSRPGQAVQ